MARTLTVVAALVMIDEQPDGALIEEQVPLTGHCW